MCAFELNGFAPRQLADLLEMNFDDGTPCEGPAPAGPATVLQEMLDEPAPGESQATDRRGPAVGDLLTDPATDLETLRRIKRFAKTLAGDAPHSSRRGAAIALYYAAIAAALVRHRTAISRHPRTTQAEAFASLMEKPWVPDNLARLFDRAGRCV